MRLRGQRQYPLVAVAAPMAVWALHFVVVYSLVGLGCEHGWQVRRIAALAPLSWALVLVTAFALVLVAWLGWHAWRRWRVLRRAPDAPPREAFMRLLTALLALLALIAVLFTAAPILMLRPCA